jgi:hypothetical protein
MKKLLLAFFLTLIGVFCFSQEFNFYELENLINRDINQARYICNVKGLRSVGQPDEGLAVLSNVILDNFEQTNTKGDVTGIVQIFYYKSDPENVGGVHIFSKTPEQYLNIIKEAQRSGMQKSNEESSGETISGTYQDKNIYIFFSNNTSESAKYSYEIHFERKLD